MHLTVIWMEALALNPLLKNGELGEG